MAIGQRIDQLHGNANMVSGAPHTAFHYVAYSQLLRNLSEITRDPTLILHDRSAANHFQIFDLGQIGEQFFLDAIGEKRVRLPRHPSATELDAS